MNSRESILGLTSINEAQAEEFLKATRRLLPGISVLDSSRKDMDGRQDAFHEFDGVSVIIVQHPPLGEVEHTETYVELISQLFDEPTGCFLANTKHYELDVFPDGAYSARYRETTRPTNQVRGSGQQYQELGRQDFIDRYREVALNAINLFKTEAALGLDIFTVEKFQEVMTVLAQCGPHNQIT